MKSTLILTLSLSLIAIMVVTYVGFASKASHNTNTERFVVPDVRDCDSTGHFQ